MDRRNRQRHERYFPQYSALPAAPEQDMRHTTSLRVSGGAPMGREHSAVSSASSGSFLSDNTQYSDTTSATAYDDYDGAYTLRADRFGPSPLYEGDATSIPRSNYEQFSGYELSSIDELTPGYQQGSSTEQLPATRASPRSLGWIPETELWRLYEVVVADKKVSHLQLLPECRPTDETPSIVFLDQLKDKYGYHCLFPGGCKGKQDVFKRPADLDRHQIQVHANEAQKEKYYCTYRRCERSKTKPFFRKDHYRDHLRDFHKEDLPGKRFRDPDSKRKWLEERKNEKSSWRCGRCLEKTHVAKDGYVCKGCNAPCEEDRVMIREQQFGVGSAPLEKPQYSNYAAPATTPQSYPSYYPSCQNCQGQEWVPDNYGGWTECPVCRPATSLSLNEAGNGGYDYKYSESRDGQSWQ